MIENILSHQEKERYSRQISLEEFGEAGQIKLKNTAVLIVGIGGVGAPLALFLSSMGVGKLGLIDGDMVELSNLPRQVLFQESDVGLSKVIAAKKALSNLNQNVDILVFNSKITTDNYNDLDINSYDFIVDGSDNFETKILLNKISLEYKKPLISVSVLECSYQVGLFNLNNNSPCLACLYPNLKTADLFSCSNAGVIGFLPSASALTAVNLLINTILNKNKQQNFCELFCYNSQNMQLIKYKLTKDKNCKVCLS